MKAMVTMMALMLGASCLGAPPPRLPAGPIPDGLGVNIHFTTPQPGEMKMLAAGGFTWVRMDFDWNQVEYEKGKYRFDAYETLMTALEEHGIRPIFILDYVHRFYDNAQSPHTDEGIAAFARFAAASAQHFRGRGILWEMYNEPNITPFWRPTVNVQDYIRLATATGKAIRAVAPAEAYIGPATSTFDWRFLEECFKGGLLDLWDAVSIHPYRPMEPETVIPDYARLRALIRRYAPKGKRIPIISGEWGYSSVWGGMDVTKQGKMLARQWLTNIACEVPLSIWYDWHDDGPDPKEPEHHFGTTLHPTHAGRDPIYDPKPAYLAAQTLTTELRGYRFNKRLIVGDRSNHVLLFAKGREVAVAAWSTQPDGAVVSIPASPGEFDAVGHVGDRRERLTGAASGLQVRLTDAPLFIKPRGHNAVLEAAAAWERLPQEIVTPHRPTLTIRAAVGRTPVAVTSAPVKATLERTERPKEVRLILRVGDAPPVVQSTSVIVSDPLIVNVGAPLAGKVTVTIENPSRRAFRGQLHITGRAALAKLAPSRIAIPAGSGEWSAALDLGDTAGEVTVKGLVADASGARILTIPARRYRPVRWIEARPSGGDPVGLDVLADGDPKVASTQTIAVADPPAGPVARGVPSLRLTYRYDKGWKFVFIRLADAGARAIEGKPSALGMWIHGDGKGNIPRLRFVDSTQQTWQPDGDPIVWTGWRWVTFPLDGTRSGRWGGADDGVIHYPIRWDSLFLLDSAGGRATEGVIHIAAPTLIYNEGN